MKFRRDSSAYNVKIEKRDAVPVDSQNAQEEETLPSLEQINDPSDPSGLQDLIQCLQTHREQRMSLSINLGRVTYKRLIQRIAFYNISLSIGISKYEFRRTFAEFEALQDLLRERMPFCCVPPLRRKGIGNEQDADIKVIKGLELFITDIVRHPFLRLDTAFQYFCDNKIDKFKPKYLGTLEGSQSNGFKLFIKFVRQCQTPGNSGGYLKGAKASVASAKNCLAKIEKDLDKFVANLGSHAAEMRECSNTFNFWKEIEATQLREVAGVHFSQDSDASKNLPVSLMVSGIEKAFTVESEELEKKAAALRQIINGPLTYEKMVLEEFKSGLKRANERINLYRKKEKRHADLQTAYNKSRGGAQLSSERKKIELDEAGRDKIRALELAHYGTRGMVIELNRYRREKAIRIAPILRALAEANVKYSLAVKSLWEEKLDSIPTSAVPSADLELLERIREDRVFANKSPIRVFNDVSVDDQTGFYEEEAEVEDESVDYTNSNNAQSAVPEVRRSIRALVSYRAESQNELSLERGEILHGTLSSKNPEWIWTTNPKTGETGYVHTENVEILENLQNNGNTQATRAGDQGFRYGDRANAITTVT